MVAEVAPGVAPVLGATLVVPFSLPSTLCLQVLRQWGLLGPRPSLHRTSLPPLLEEWCSLRCPFSDKVPGVTPSFSKAWKERRWMLSNGSSSREHLLELTKA